MLGGQAKSFAGETLNIARDAVHEYFDPLRSVWRYFFGPRWYRVRYTYDNGMTFSAGEKKFEATNDREALKKARSIVGCDFFELEQYREIEMPGP